MTYMSERDWQAIVRDLTAERDLLAAEVRRLRRENEDGNDALVKLGRMVAQDRNSDAVRITRERLHEMEYTEAALRAKLALTERVSNERGVQLVAAESAIERVRAVLDGWDSTDRPTEVLDAVVRALDDLPATPGSA